METQQRLWEREIIHPTHIDTRGRRRRKPNATKTSNGEERKKFVGLRTNSSNKSKVVVSSTTDSKSPSNSLSNVDGRLTSSLQMCGNQVPKAVLPRSQRSSSARERTDQRRPHTSLGFRWNKSSHLRQSLPSSRTLLGPPQGFDLTEYVRRVGTTEGIQIGINGRPVNIWTYLEECKENSCSSDIDEDIDLNHLPSVSEGSMAHRQQVPLCWEDQLKMAHPASILSSNGSKTNKKCIIVQHQPHTTEDSDIPQSSTIMDAMKFESIVSKTCVTLTWRESCILGSTPLSELNPALRSQFPPPLVTDGNSMNSERPGTMSLTDFNTDIHDSGSSSAQLAEWIEKVKQEEMATPGSSYGVVSDVISDLLCIWFNTADSAAQKELVNLSFEVFVTATETVDQNLVELSTKAFKMTSPQEISETVSVIPVHLCEGDATSDFIRCREMKLTIICDQPRSILFSSRINLFSDQPVPEQTSQLLRPVDDIPASKAPFKHHLIGSLEVPQHYCKRRSSYCDQELDEDKTDLEGLTRQFPDLMVLEYEGTAAAVPINHTGVHSSKPSSLPVQEEELMRLNSISVKVKRKPLPFSLQLETYTNRHRSVKQEATNLHKQPLPFALWDPKSDTPSFVTTYSVNDVTKRPLFRPVTPQDIKATRNSNMDYTEIVSSRLMPYMK